jgi:uncharacterized membrane protein
LSPLRIAVQRCDKWSREDAERPSWTNQYAKQASQVPRRVAAWVIVVAAADFDGCHFGVGDQHGRDLRSGTGAVFSQRSACMSGEYVPTTVVDWLRTNRPDEGVPGTGNEVYRLYVEERFLQPQIVIPVFLCVFVLLLYLLGKFLTAGIGGWFDWGILRLPIVRKVYAAVKQVTDFVFGENLGEVLPAHYKQVVAIEYPRPGMWSVGLVMGEAVSDVNTAANEPCVTVMLPTSPALFTVKPVMIPQSKTHNLNMTIDQALQFVISCGVVLPAHQLTTGGESPIDSTAVDTAVRATTATQEDEKGSS